MPQADVEIVVRDGGSGGDRPPEAEAAAAAAEEDPDLPAESIRVLIGNEIGWVDINAVYERDDSTKGNTNPKSQQQHHQKPTRSGSQRFSGNLAPPMAPIIGLPNKIQHSGYLGHSARRPPKGRIFPKGAAGGRGGRKSAVPEAEPGSPKVSCIGKVLSDRERKHRQVPPAAAEEERGGCWASVVGFFRCVGGERTAVVECVEEESFASPPSSGGVQSARPSRVEVAEAPEAAPPGIAGMKRFSSGRRPASWGGDLDGEAKGHVAWSGQLDREEMWGRRSVGSLEDAVRPNEW